MTSDLNLEHSIILDLIKPGSSVLDLGCGEGDLLAALARDKKARVQGIEIDEQAIYKCVSKGLSVLHGDIDTGLPDYGDKSFDYVVLNQVFQQVKKPDVVLTDALRVGKQVIVSFPNFAHRSARIQMFFGGHAPITPSLPYQWYDTPNIHFLSISDFTRFCSQRRIRVMASAFTANGKRVRFFPNCCALVGIFVLENGR